MQQEKEFNFWCFKPSNKALYNFILYGFAIYGMYTFGIISQLMGVWHSVGHQIVVFLVIYYMTYELFEFWEYIKLNQFTKKLGEGVLQKFLYIDEKINTDLYKEVDEQISCLSTNLQVILMMLSIPESKARKITVKKAGLFLLKIPVYLVVFLIIIFWDVFYKNIAPAIWNTFTYLIQGLFWISGLEWLTGYIKTCKWYKNLSKYIEEQKLIEIILVIGFTLIFGGMEGLKFAALSEFSAGEFLNGVYFYIGSITTLLVVKPYNKKFGERMMTVNWYKIRYKGIVSLMEIFESTNSYINVIAQLEKVKAIIRTVWKQFKAIFSVIRQIISAYIRNFVNSLRVATGFRPLEESESVNLLKEIKREHDSLWRGIKSAIKNALDSLKNTLEDEDDEFIGDNCIDLQYNYDVAISELSKAERYRVTGHSLGAKKSAVTRAQKALEKCKNNKEDSDDK